MLPHVSTYQGNPFWPRCFEPQPDELPRAGPNSAPPPSSPELPDADAVLLAWKEDIAAPRLKKKSRGGKSGQGCLSFKGRLVFFLFGGTPFVGCVFFWYPFFLSGFSKGNPKDTNLFEGSVLLPRTAMIRRGPGF